VSHSYQTYFGFPGSDLNLDCGLRDHEVRISLLRFSISGLIHNIFCVSISNLIINFSNIRFYMFGLKSHDILNHTKLLN